MTNIERKWYDVEVGIVSVYAECKEEAQEILDEIQNKFPKRTDPNKPNFEMEVIDIKRAD